MSSKIRVQRICQHCNNEFTARTTVTKYCSDNCAKKAYKARKRAEKIEQSNKATIQVKQRSVLEVQNKEFLNVADVAVLLGCSKRTVYRLIDSGTIKAVNLGERLTRIMKYELIDLMEQSKPKPKAIEYTIEDCYKLTEIKDRYGLSDNGLHKIIQRNNIPKIKKGWYTYVPKQIIDQVLHQVV